MTTIRAHLALFLVASILGCEPLKPFADGFAPGEVTCTTCHGDARSPAPPSAVDGSTETSALGVGAHRVHLVDGPVRVALPCSECHVVPASPDDLTHVDPLPADVWFGPLSKVGELEPTWDRNTARCSATYCHGGERVGAADPEPLWTLVDGSQVTCASCHGAPPPFPHVPDARCWRCHSETVTTDLRILTGNQRHVNGIVDVDPMTCVSCHGTFASGAPPPDLVGAVDTASESVGAHAAHPEYASGRHAGVPCASCHVVPLSDDAAGHRDTPRPAEVAFSGRAIGDGPAPVYDGIGCSNVACHSGAGGAHTEPLWTVVDGSQITCASCHGYPPPVPHIQSDRCERCHGLVAYEGEIALPNLHVNGVLELDEPTCTVCHGTESTPTSFDDAHRGHLLTQGRAKPVACDACHIVPTAVFGPPHLDGDNVAEVVFGPLATANGALVSTYDAPTCSNVACHGGDGANGGALVTPAWNVLDGSQVACGTCHGLPPPAPHPPRNDCVNCHSALYAASGTFAGGSLHVDGEVEVDGVGCVGCHGSDTESAPPRDTEGNTETSARGVGAHRVHIDGSAYFGPVACNECHVVPVDLDDEDHMDTPLPAEVKFGPIAETNGVDPFFDGVSCSNVACHGAGLPNEGGLHLTPVWTVVDGSQRTCFSCHGFPPQGTHPQEFACVDCHAAVIAANATFVRPDLHANGVINFMDPPASDFMHGAPDVP